MEDEWDAFLGITLNRAGSGNLSGRELSELVPHLIWALAGGVGVEHEAGHGSTFSKRRKGKIAGKWKIK